MKKFHLAYAHFMLINVFLQINWIRCYFIDSVIQIQWSCMKKIIEFVTVKKIVFLFVCLCLKVYMLTIELLSTVSFSFFFCQVAYS